MKTYITIMRALTFLGLALGLCLAVMTPINEWFFGLLLYAMPLAHSIRLVKNPSQAHFDIGVEVVRRYLWLGLALSAGLIATGASRIGLDPRGERAVLYVVAIGLVPAMISFGILTIESRRGE
ncbi:hypothetical protein [Luteococcus sp. OSA5]|uniref:hypothetical protein n=1 Tax=Luteococcus sp. OSA5 TaxID=3401630 RepID=UPI003B429CE1